MERLPNENFEDYKVRRNALKAEIKEKLRGTYATAKKITTSLLVGYV